MSWWSGRKSPVGSHQASARAVNRLISSDEAVEGVSRYALDPDAAERLWALSEEAVGERFAFAD